MLAYAVWADLVNADSNFLNSKPDPQYASPMAYMQNMIEYAKSLTQNNFKIPYAPPMWNPQAAGMAAAFNAFAMLSQIPVNIGDPATVSVMQAWELGTGSLYGGHLPAAPVTTVSAGQEAAPPHSVL